MQFQSAIVGMHFRPPAKHLVKALPMGIPLILVPDPLNPYDEHAVKVMLDLHDIPEDQEKSFWEEVTPLLKGTGCNKEELLIEPRHIAFIASKDNLDVLKPIGQGLASGCPYTASFSRNMAGVAMVIVEFHEDVEDAPNDFDDSDE
jgi:hypothetical protein